MKNVVLKFLGQTSGNASGSGSASSDPLTNGWVGLGPWKKSQSLGFWSVGWRKEAIWFFLGRFIGWINRLLMKTIVKFKIIVIIWAAGGFFFCFLRILGHSLLSLCLFIATVWLKAAGPSVPKTFRHGIGVLATLGRWGKKSGQPSTTWKRWRATQWGQLCSTARWLITCSGHRWPFAAFNGAAVLRLSFSRLVPFRPQFVIKFHKSPKLKTAFIALIKVTEYGGCYM